METVRVGGARSGRAAIVVAAILLGSVVWIGVSGRVPPRPESSLPSAASAAPAVAAVTARTSPSPDVPVATVEPTPRVEQPTPAPAAQPTRRPRPTRSPFSEDIFLDLAAPEAIGVIAVVDGRQYLKVLREAQPGRLEAAFRLPFPVDDGGHRLQLAQLWTQQQDQRNYVELGNWPLSFGGLSPVYQPDVPILEEFAPARPRLRDGPRLRKRGFTLTLRAESWDGHAVIRVELVVGPVRD